MPRLVFHGYVKTFGHDAAKDGGGNVLVGEPSAMNYWTIRFEAPEDEFTDLGAPDDPLMEKKPHAVLYIYNMTIPDIEKTIVGGKAKIVLEIEE